MGENPSPPRSYQGFLLRGAVGFRTSRTGRTSVAAVFVVPAVTVAKLLAVFLQLLRLLGRENRFHLRPAVLADLPGLGPPLLKTKRSVLAESLHLLALAVANLFDLLLLSVGKTEVRPSRSVRLLRPPC